MPSAIVTTVDAGHPLEEPFLPQTPLGSPTPPRVVSPPPDKRTRRRHSPWLSWAVDPKASLRVLLFPVLLFVNWEFLSPVLWRVSQNLPPAFRPSQATLPTGNNPFSAFFLISYHIPTSSPDDPRYAKGYLDLLFVAYYIVFFSFTRQIIAVNLSGRAARMWGIKRETRIERFGEQVYSLIYWGTFGCWGWRIMKQLPTNWYETRHFWLGYPHWDMKPELKRYYLMQAAYWSHQMFVLVLGLERPRKDYVELVCHHIVTIWMVGWSYLTNLTMLGQAVFLSMDVPDTALALSLLLNYMQMDKSKALAFAVLIVTWTYFRIALYMKMLWSVWNEFDLIPASSMRWSPKDGVWLVSWMRYQMFVPMFLLQLLNLFWFFLILRILYRAITGPKLDDERDEDDEEKEKAE